MKTPFDIILVQPPFDGQYNFWKSENLGMGYLASSLESEGYTVEIIDAFLLDMSIDEVVSKVMSSPPRILLGFSILSFQLYTSAQSIMKRLRENGVNVHVTFGSWFPTFWYEEIINENDQVNSIVLGEGEIAIKILANYIDTGKWPLNYENILQLKKFNNTLVISQKNEPQELDSLPNPRRDYQELVFQKYNLITSQTSRGCGHNSCSFCSVPSFYRGKGNHRFRSAKNVIDEIRSITKSEANFIFFTDEDFIGRTKESQNRAVEIFEGLAELNINLKYAINCPVKEIDETLFKRLRELGLEAVYVGIESNNSRCLKLFGKGVNTDDVYKTVDIISNLGIKIVPGWIMFERDTTFEEIQEEMDFLRKIDSYHVNYLKSLYVMKDTPMEKLYGEDLYKTFFYSKYYFRDPQVDLLVRILMDDYLPEVMPYTNNIYPIWHKLLGGFGTNEEQEEYEYINRKIIDLSFSFIEEVMTKIRLKSLEGIAQSLSFQIKEWHDLGRRIDFLSSSMSIDELNIVRIK